MDEGRGRGGVTAKERRGQSFAERGASTGRNLITEGAWPELWREWDRMGQSLIWGGDGRGQDLGAELDPGGAGTGLARKWSQDWGGA